MHPCTHRMCPFHVVLSFCHFLEDSLLEKQLEDCAGRGGQNLKNNLRSPTLLCVRPFFNHCITSIPRPSGSCPWLAQSQYQTEWRFLRWHITPIKANIYAYQICMSTLQAQGTKYDCIA
ncbi:unnamed protein product [Choristocarpus tenellus]